MSLSPISGTHLAVVALQQLQLPPVEVVPQIALLGEWVEVMVMRKLLGQENTKVRGNRMIAVTTQHRKERDFLVELVMIRTGNLHTCWICSPPHKKKQNKF